MRVGFCTTLEGRITRLNAVHYKEIMLAPKLLPAEMPSEKEKVGIVC
jgi:hypothetical protein